ncbi:MAG: polysaccharide deacetylase family protein [Lachnospiraceae bacterium]
MFNFQKGIFHPFSFKTLLLSAAFLLLLLTAFTLPAAVMVSTTQGSRELPIYCVQTYQNKIALKFDSAWGNEDTADLLSILARNQIHATFFLTGSWVDAYPDDVKAIAAAGHDIGNHSQTHPEMSTLSKEQIRDELMQVHKNVKELTGQNMCFFRPPYGDYNNLLIQTATECGYLSIQWDIDSLDWKDYGIQSIIDKTALNPELSNGSIILMHNGAKYTKDALETVISTLQSKGYEFVTLSELVYKDHFHMDPSGKQIPD